MRFQILVGGSLLRAAIVLVLAAPLAMGCSRFVEGLRSQIPPSGTASAERFHPGPFRVTTADFEFVDPSRPTLPNGDFAGAAMRTLEATIWRPEGVEESRPLLVYAHGFTGNRREMLYLLEHLASHGTVVAAFDFPGGLLRATTNQSDWWARRSSNPRPPDWESSDEKRPFRSGFKCLDRGTASACCN